MELLWIIAAVLGIAVVYILNRISKLRSADYWEKQGVPYCGKRTFTGFFEDVFLKRKSADEIISYIYNKYGENKKCVGAFYVFTPTIIIFDPDLVNKILIEDFSHFEDRGEPAVDAKDLFNLSFSNLTGDDWRNVRNRLAPTFTCGKMKIMFETMKECSEEVVVYLNERTDQDLEVKDILTKFVLNLIGNTAFGLKIDTFNENDKMSMEFYKYSTMFFKPSFAIMFKFMISLTMPKISKILKLKLTDRKVEMFFINLAKDIMKYRKGTDAKRKDFLQLLIDLKEKEEYELQKGLKSSDKFSHYGDELIESDDKELGNQLKHTPSGYKQDPKSEIFTDEFIAAQTFSFISGGSETTAASLAFVIYELARHQPLQKKVQEEISDILSRHKFNFESIKKLTYMEQFINETFRLNPVEALLVRMCTKDYKIPGTDAIIKKGNLVNIPICGLHKDPRYFPDPEKFNPDRFKDMDAIPKGVYFPFGGGPRMCVAMRLAMLEMKVFLTIILSHNSITLCEKMEKPLKFSPVSFINHVEGGVWVKFHKRQF